jgi:MYXO-CTERM domain-containing protein
MYFASASSPFALASYFLLSPEVIVRRIRFFAFAVLCWLVSTMSATAGPITFNFSGSSGLDGGDGNIRTFASSGLSVNVSAFSRDSSGVWATAWLGSYGGGLGVTDSSEGNGGSNKHTVDNLSRDNYVLFEFSETVVVDWARLGYVVDDSDLQYWVGNKTNPFSNHGTLSDAYLTSLGFTEPNTTTSADPRTADLNASLMSGNVLVIAAWPGDGNTSPDDEFKIEKLKVHTTVPDPASGLTLLALGLAGLAGLRRRW